MAKHPLMPDIVEFLQQGPASVSDLIREFGGWRMTMRLKLMRLLRAGVIHRVKIGTAESAKAVYYLPEGGAAQRWVFHRQEIADAWLAIAPTLTQWHGAVSRTTLVFIFISTGRFVVVYPQSLEYVREQKAKYFVNTFTATPKELVKGVDGATDPTWKWIAEHSEKVLDNVIAKVEAWNNVQLMEEV